MTEKLLLSLGFAPLTPGAGRAWTFSTSSLFPSSNFRFLGDFLMAQIEVSSTMGPHIVAHCTGMPCVGKASELAMAARLARRARLAPDVLIVTPKCPA